MTDITKATPPQSPDGFTFDLQRFASTFGGGNGTSSNPYKISTVAHLQQLSNDVNNGTTYEGKYFKLTANIDLSTVSNWTPIGNSSNQFKGTFDGGKTYDAEGNCTETYTIRNLTVNLLDNDCVGLFGYVVYGTIQNVTLTNVNVSGGNQNVGALVGYNYYGMVSNCTVSGKVTGQNYVGGLVGFNYGTVTDCTVTGTISGFEYVGGLVGLNDSGTVTDCTVTGTVSGTQGVGGLVGYNSSGTVIGGTAITTVSGSYSGGVVGYNDSGMVGTAEKPNKFYSNYGAINNAAADNNTQLYKLTLQGVTVTGGTFATDTDGNYYATGNITVAAKTGYTLNSTSVTVSADKTITATLDTNGHYVFSNGSGGYTLATNSNVTTAGYPDLTQVYALTLPEGVTAADGVITASGNYYVVPGNSVTLSSNVNGAIIGAATATGGSVTVNSNGTATLTTTSSAATVTPTLYYSVSGLDNVTASGGTYATVNGTTYYAPNSSVTLTSNVDGAIIGAASATGGSVTVNSNGTATLTTTSSAATVTSTLYYSVTVPSGVSVSGNTSKTVDGTTYYADNVTLSATDNNAVIRSTSYTNNIDGTVSFTPAAATDFSDDLTFYYTVSVPNCVDSVSGTSITVSNTNYYQSGSTLTLTAKTGYVVDNVTVSSDTSITATLADGHYVFGTSGNYTLATTTNTTDYPELVQVYALTVPDGVTASGDICVTVDGTTYAAGEVTIAAADGYSLQNVKVDGESLTDNLTFTVGADATISAEIIKFGNGGKSVEVGGTTGDLSTNSGVYSITASQENSTLVGNDKNNTVVLTGGGENILTGGGGNDTYKFESGGGIVTDFGIGATKSSTGATLSTPLGSDIIKLGGKVTGVYFDRAASSKKSATFTAIVTYDSTTIEGDDTQIIVLQNINKKPTKYGSNPVYQTNDAAAATFKIWDTSGGSSKVLSASKLKALFHDDSELSDELLSQIANLGKLDGIGELKLPAVDALNQTAQATYSGSND